MRKKLAAGSLLAVALVALLFGRPRTLQAQQGQQPALHVVVVKDVMHVVSPRLGGMTPIPPAYGLRKQIPLRHPMPLQSRAQAKQDPVLQTLIEPLVSATNGQNFSGVGEGLGTFKPSYAPPDTNGAAGATQYVQWVNVNFAVFSKSTGSVVYGPAAGNTLWQPLGGACSMANSGDPIAEYDKQAQRWVMMQPVFASPYYLCVAVSTTSDATGTYNLYQFPIPGSYFPDYPKLSVWPDGYYLSYNAFSGNRFISAYACALDRASMLQGQSATMQCFNSGGYPSLLPADLDGDSGASGTTAAPPAGAPDYFVDFSGTSSLNLFEFHADWSNSANSTFTGPISIPVASFSEACGGGTCIPQPGTTEQLDSLGDRLMYRFAYRNFGSYQSLVVSQSVDTGSGNTGIRWYEIRNPGTSPTLYQQGTFDPDANFRWMPSIAEDEAGDIALGYSVSSSSLYPSIRFTGRVPTDPLGALESESSIVQGTGAQQSNLNRWGDYSSMSVDPTDDCTFWYTNEFLESNGTFNWSTRIASFHFPGCSGTPGFSVSASPSPQTISAGSSANYTVAVSPSGSYSGNVGLSVSSPNPLPAGMSVSFSPSSADLTGSGVVDSTLTVSTSSSMSSGTYNFTITGSGTTISNSTQATVVVDPPPTPNFSLSSSPGSTTVTQGNSANYTIAVSPSGSFTGSVGLVANGLPAGATASFNPSSVSTSSGTATSSLTLSTSSSTPAGTYSITVTGTSGNLIQNLGLTLVVQSSGGNGDFSVAISPASQSVGPKSNVSYAITVTGLNAFTGSVSLSVSGLPNRTNANFSPSTIAGSGASTLTISTTPKSPAGTYSLKVTGTSGGITHTVSATVTIT